MNQILTSFIGALLLTAVYYWYISCKKEKQDISVKIVVCFVGAFLFVFCAQALLMCGSKQEEMMKYVDKSDPQF
jgi:uncharacterized membrane protein YeaQ/YmgE (transglycosylase-associated protein family)